MDYYDESHTFEELKGLINQEADHHAPLLHALASVWSKGRDHLAAQAIGLRDVQDRLVKTGAWGDVAGGLFVSTLDHVREIANSWSFGGSPDPHKSVPGIGSSVTTDELTGSITNLADCIIDVRNAVNNLPASDTEEEKKKYTAFALSLLTVLYSDAALKLKNAVGLPLTNVPLARSLSSGPVDRGGTPPGPASNSPSPGGGD
ncbi:hypothetical protein FNH05_29725, partial [Amycolatopsis rhizosphaerae]